MSGILMMSVGNSYGYKPINTVAPAVTGTATVGQTLSCSTGTWDAAPAAITYTYQWQRGTTNISGATSSTYVVQSADAGNTLRCVVTATNAVGATSANSNSTASVTQAPVNTVAPSVSGTAQVGQTLSSTTGTWTGTPASFTYAYQWQRSGSNISGANSSTYVVQSADVGSTLRCVVTATNSAGSTSANSNSTASVTPATGQTAYTSPGTYTFVVPAGVTSISAVVVAGGGGGAHSTRGMPGGGGGLAYINNTSVTPGESLTVTVGAGGAGGVSFSGGQAGGNSQIYRGGTKLVRAIGGGAGTNGGVPGSGGGADGYSGGAGGSGGYSSGSYGGGGGGAGGYSGSGGSGGNGSGNAGSAGTGGAGGGGGSGGQGAPEYCGYVSYLKPGNGGGVGIFGQGSNGAGGAGSATGPGADGGAGSGGSGQTYGGGGSGPSAYFSAAACGFVPTSYAGGGGAVRILWPGNTRSFPSTNTGNL